MADRVVEKIDMFCHILTPRYNEAINRKARPCYYTRNNKVWPALTDLDLRFRHMDQYPGLRQVLSMAVPPLEYAVDAADAVDLARRANDEMAELVGKHPDRFAAGIASLPMNDVDAAIDETERAVETLGLKGIQVYTPVNGKPLDRPEFLPLYEKMAAYDLPIWIHPARDMDVPDYPGESQSKYRLFVFLSWPYETSMAMARLVFSGVLERIPGLTLIAHHCGAMIPFFSQRMLGVGADMKPEHVPELTRPIPEYFKKFYADTVLNGNTPALMLGHSFFGAEHMIFATDYPYPGGPEKCGLAVGQVIASVERMAIPETEKALIFAGNAKRMLKIG